MSLPSSTIAEAAARISSSALVKAELVPSLFISGKGRKPSDTPDLAALARGLSPAALETLSRILLRNSLRASARFPSSLRSST